MWGHIGSFGVIWDFFWDHLGLLVVIWGYSWSFGVICSNSGSFGVICSNSRSFEDHSRSFGVSWGFWSFRVICGHSGAYRVIWSYLGPFRAILGHLESFGLRNSFVLSKRYKNKNKNKNKKATIESTSLHLTCLKY